MLKPGKYRTESGSTMTISGKHGGISEVDFDWFEEDACIECSVESYDQDGYLVWYCDECGGGSAKLLPVVDNNEPVV